MPVNSQLAEALAQLDTKEPVTQAEVLQVEHYLRDKISPDDIAACNQHLGMMHRSHITMTDLACMLVLHAKSVRENNGDSPHKRFIKWSASARNTFCGKWDSIHVKVGLIALTASKVTIKTGEPAKRKAASYKLHKEVLFLLFPVPTPKIKDPKIKDLGSDGGDPLRLRFGVTASPKPDKPP